MSLTVIAAVDLNNVIGVDNRLPWRLPADLARFKRLTMGHRIIMGRRTWESIGRPLQGRTSVVVTRNRELDVPDGVVVAPSLPAAIAACAGDDEPFVIGGAELYRHALPIAQRIQLTVIEKEFYGDTHFPVFDRTGWQLSAIERFCDDDLPFRFETWERRTMV